jgi:hypothetical protein
MCVYRSAAVRYSREIIFTCKGIEGVSTMSAEFELKRALLLDKGWSLEGDAYVHSDRNYTILAASLVEMTVDELKDRIA